MRIRIPASSANLGPGFDCFGIAWQLYDEIEFLKTGSGLSVSGCPEEFRNRENLCYAGYTAALRYCGLPEHPLSIRFLGSSIPISRGLGSSAALIAGGVFAADRLNALSLSPEELLDIAARTEGHPDNIAPALFGGFTASAVDDGRSLSVSFPLSGRLSFTALVPDFRLSTELARSVLPEKYSRSDAVFNISRSALLIKALGSGDMKLMRSAVMDRLHQSYRFPLIKGYDTAAALAGEHCCMCISGAGPTILCISGDSGLAEKLRDPMSTALPGWKVLPLRPDMHGAAVIKE